MLISHKYLNWYCQQYFYGYLLIEYEIIMGWYHVGTAI